MWVVGAQYISASRVDVKRLDSDATTKVLSTSTAFSHSDLYCTVQGARSRTFENMGFSFLNWR